MTAFEIPLSPNPQRFLISLAGTARRLTFRWCQPMSAWFMDVADSSDVPILSGVPLITGADLLGQYEYLGLGGAFFAQSESDPRAVPNFTNLGQDGKLFFVVPD